MTQREAALLQSIFEPYDQMFDVWVKHYGIKVALEDHPDVQKRRARAVRRRLSSLESDPTLAEYEELLRRSSPWWGPTPHLGNLTAPAPSTISLP